MGQRRGCFGTPTVSFDTAQIGTRILPVSVGRVTADQSGSLSILLARSTGVRTSRIDSQVYPSRVSRDHASLENPPHRDIP